MVLIIAAKRKCEEHISVAVSVNCILITMAKLFSFSEPLQE